MKMGVDRKGLTAVETATNASYDYLDCVQKNHDGKNSLASVVDCMDTNDMNG